MGPSSLLGRKGRTPLTQFKFNKIRRDSDFYSTTLTICDKNGRECDLMLGLYSNKNTFYLVLLVSIFTVLEGHSAFAGHGNDADGAEASASKRMREEPEEIEEIEQDSDSLQGNVSTKKVTPLPLLPYDLISNVVDFLTLKEKIHFATASKESQSVVKRSIFDLSTQNFVVARFENAEDFAQFSQSYRKENGRKLEKLKIELRHFFPTSEQWASFFGHLNGLKELDLSKNSMGADRVKALVPGLSNLTNLKALYLQSNGIRNQGVSKLAKALESLTQLRVLNLSSNHIGDSSLPPLAFSLSQLTQLESLDFSNNQIGDKGMLALKSGLFGLTHLKSLKFHSNTFGDHGAKVLSDIAKNNRLYSLTLFHNKIGPRGAIDFAEALSSFESLDEIDFSENPIGDQGMIALVNALGQHNHLQVHSMRFSNSRVDDAGVLFLNHTIKRFPQLKSLHLDRNKIKGESAIPLMAALSSLTAFESISLFENDIDEADVEVIRTALGDRKIDLEIENYDLLTEIW